MTSKMRAVCVAFFACLIATSIGWAQPADVTADPTGEWLVAKQYARIKIANCDGRLWGVVAWESQPGVDTKNPDPDLRNRPTLGMPILLGMTPTKANRWEGQIYNSQDGHTYSASINLVDPNTLRVEGCFLRVLCGGEKWTRVETTDAPVGPPPASAPPKSSKPPDSRKAAGNQPQTPDDVCSRVVGAAGLPHERGLK
jgi:uncharacterized protein (DUF2147 family)